MSEESKSLEGPRRGSETWWTDEIRSSLEARRKDSTENRWNDIEGYWNHDFPGGDPVHNMIYQYGRSLLPTVIFQAPRIIHTPRYPKYIADASTMDSVCSWLMQEMEAEDVYKTSALYSYLYNIGAVQIGFDFPGKPDISEENFVEQNLLAHAGVSKVDHLVDRARRKNFPWIEVIPPRQLIFDSMTKKMRACRWYGKNIIMPTRILKKMEDLKRSAVKSTHIPTELLNKDIRDLIEKRTNAEPLTSFWEIHDAEEGEWFWITSNGEFLFDPIEDPLQIDGLPLDPLIFNENPNSIWGTPDVMYIENLMLEGNETRRFVKKERRLSLLKMIVNQNLLKKQEVEKLFEEEIAVLFSDELPPDGDLSKAIVPIQSHIQQDKYTWQEKLKEDARDILGFGNNQLGTFATGRRSATESQLVDQTNKIRENERRRMMAKQISGGFRKINQIVKRYWTAPILVRVIGVDGARYWVETKPSDIQSEMELSVDVESMVPPSNERTKQEMVQVLQIVAQLPNFNVVPIIRQLLSKFSWADIDTYLPQAVQDKPYTLDQFSAQQDQLISDANHLGSTARNNVRGLMEVKKR